MSNNVPPIIESTFDGDIDAYFDRIVAIFEDELADAFDLSETDDTPFTVLIATVLSQRSRDENTYEAKRALFEKYPDAASIANAELSDIEELIKPAGVYRVKARRIRDISRIILDRYDGETPSTMEELLTLPGVGRKTANCVLVQSFDTPAIPVDTHVHRISNRMGWVRTDRPAETEEALRALIPRRHWIAINGLMVKHGRNICGPRRPRCEQCYVRQYCAYGLGDDLEV